MAYINVYPSRITWENYPSVNTPIDEINLNKMDYALYQHDQTFANWDVTKADRSDLLLSVKGIDYDTNTGVFVFTWQDGTTKTVDLNIEKIPVSFSMSSSGVITMVTEDGTSYTADISSLIKTYTFTDSSVIDFTVTTDSSGNKTVTATIIDGSITASKLQPNFLADCQQASTDAETAATSAIDSASDAEAWAVGKRNGVDVGSEDPAYHNNSKYYSEQAGVIDTEMSTESVNAVQNKVITDYVDRNATNLNNMILAIADQAKGETKSATITAGQTTAVLTGWEQEINEFSYISIYVDTYGVVPTDVTYTPTSVTIEIPVQSADVKVSAMIFTRT